MIIGNSNNFRHLAMGSGGGDKTDPPQVPLKQPEPEEKDSTENKV